MTRHPLIYAHGLPGSAAELIPVPGFTPTAILAPASDGTPDLATLPQTACHVVAFSLGAHRAIDFAASHPARVSQLTLIAPVAPLQIGDFLPHMAGRAVFRAARLPLALRLLTAVQNRLPPDRLLDLAFRDSAPADRALLDDPLTRQAILQTFRDSLPTPAYRHALQRYVRPWTPLLPQIACPVAIHHGSDDSWAPPAMSEALALRLRDATLIRHPGLGHHSTLFTVLPTL